METLSREDRRDWRAIETLLKAKYEGAVAQMKAKDSLKMLRRGPKETLDELVRRIKGLTKRAFPSESKRQEEEGIDALKGCASSDIFLHLATKSYTTLDACADDLAKLETHHLSHARTAGRGPRISQMEAKPTAGQEKGATCPAAAAPSSPKGSRKRPEQASRKDQDIKGPTNADILTFLKRNAAAWNASNGWNRKQGGGQGRRPDRNNRCRICNSDQHWAAKCPNKKEEPLVNRKGLGQGSGTQSQK